MSSLSSPLSVRALRAFPRMAGVFSVAMGACVLVGWMFDLSFLKSVLPGQVSMKANTALGFMLAGAALWLLLREEDRKRQVMGSLPSVLCAAGVAALGILTLTQDVLGIDLGVDELLFRDAPFSPGTWSPGRMAPFTALNFFLIGMAVWLQGREDPRAPRVAAALTCVAVLNSTLTLLRYVLTEEPFVGLAVYAQMAVHTALTFVVVGVGVLLARPERGPMAVLVSDGVGATVARRLLPAALLIPPLLGWLRWQGEQAGLYSGAFGVALFATATAGTFSVFIWWMARGLEASDTARRSVEAERDRFFTLSLDLLCVAGFDGYFKRLNPAWEKALGFTTQELLQTPYMELVHPADREATAAEALGLSGGGVTLSFENRYVTKSGAHRWLLWSAVAVPGQEQIYAVARDITERKLAEETLQRLAIIVESSDDAIIHNDLEGNVLSWNRGAVQLFGFTAEEVLGRPAPITPPDRVHERQMFRQRLLEGGKLEQYETQQLHKDGRLRDISLTISAVRNQRAEIVGAATIARDITETKRNQNAIRDLNHQLEQRLAELSASNQELEAFSYSVSHDLRAPLRQVHGFAKVVEEQYGRQLDSQGQHYLGRIEEGAAKMGRLIDDLLNLSRLGRRPLQRQPTELAALVEGVCTDLQAEINGRKVEWRIQPLPSADCDPGLIKQVFANLLENSLKYTRPRERALIEVGQRAENGEQMIYVRDNGVGFNMKYADKLFGVFQRLHRSDEFEGTGVGLATVQRIVQKHGGRIWAEGEEGQGATFCFTLGAAGAAASVDLQVEEIRT